MTRELLLKTICPNAYIDVCTLVGCEHCNVQLNEWLDEYDKHVIEEHFAKIMSFINTSNRGNSDYFIIDQIENYIIEQLKENNI